MQCPGLSDVMSYVCRCVSVYVVATGGFAVSMGVGGLLSAVVRAG